MVGLKWASWFGLDQGVPGRRVLAGFWTWSVGLSFCGVLVCFVFVIVFVLPLFASLFVFVALLVVWLFVAFVCLRAPP